MQEMLGKAGFALSHSSKFDIIVEYFVEWGNYNVYEINEEMCIRDRAEALAISIGERGRVDLPYMSELLGTPGEYEKIQQELHGEMCIRDRPWHTDRADCRASDDAEKSDGQRQEPA